jgi:Flp pilus assembly pilin Flp
MRILRALRGLAADQSGATAVEYALIIMAIAGVIIAVVVTFGGKVKSQYDSVQNNMP